MASVQVSSSAVIDINGRHVHEEDSPDSDDSESIPYHARVNALPFTYGSLPAAYTAPDTVTDVHTETPIEKQVHNVYQASPSAIRKSTRPSISPSRPVLRKTPSRQEFEEMLMERKEQALRENRNEATKIAQNAAIQKDLYELHERLNMTGLGAKEGSKQQMLTPKIKSMTFGPVVKHVESIDLQDVAQPLAMVLPKFEPDLLLQEVRRPETPTFPVMQRTAECDHRISPYPTSKTPQPIAVEEQKRREKAKSKSIPAIEMSSETQKVEPHLVKFAKDSSEFWYKPHMTREEAVDILRDAQPGTFLIRNSTTYADAYGLVLRVAQVPPNTINTSRNGDQLVRHFLLEPTTRGVRLKGCTNEPIFTSLSAFVYQHSINQMALPCSLTIPVRDLLSPSDEDFAARKKQVLLQGAACNVLYLFQCDTESLTGDEAVRKAIYEMYSQAKLPDPVEVHFKVSQQGITLTDNDRKLFFRRHYATQNISHFSMDPENHLWRVAANDEGLERIVNKSIFAFVARSLTGSKDNHCHVFCDLTASQPAYAIVAFAQKVLQLNESFNKML